MAHLHWLGPGYDLMTASPSTDRMFERFFGYRSIGQETGTPTYALPVDILETEDAYELHASVAGVPQEAVDVTFEDDRLKIAVKAAPIPVQGKFIRQERPWGNWVRQLELPKEVDATNIAAEFENGLLIVRVPKVAKAQPQRIAIAGATKAIGA
jgi:HSP20 family protein